MFHRGTENVPISYIPFLPSVATNRIVALKRVTYSYNSIISSEIKEHCGLQIGRPRAPLLLFTTPIGPDWTSFPLPFLLL